MSEEARLALELAVKMASTRGMGAETAEVLEEARAYLAFLLNPKANESAQ